MLPLWIKGDTVFQASPVKTFDEKLPDIVYKCERAFPAFPIKAFVLKMPPPCGGKWESIQRIPFKKKLGGNILPPGGQDEACIGCIPNKITLWEQGHQLLHDCMNDFPESPMKSLLRSRCQLVDKSENACSGITIKRFGPKILIANVHVWEFKTNIPTHTHNITLGENCGEELDKRENVQPAAMKSLGGKIPQLAEQT